MDQWHTRQTRVVPSPAIRDEKDDMESRSDPTLSEVGPTQRVEVSVLKDGYNPLISLDESPVLPDVAYRRPPTGPGAGLIGKAGSKGVISALWPTGGSRKAGGITRCRVLKKNQGLSLPVGWV